MAEHGTRPVEPPAGRLERRALWRSASGGAALGLVAVVWGLVADSGVILFDGIFSLAGIVLVSVSFLASYASGSGPSHRYPFGRPAATPLAVVIQGAALLATLAYGVVDAVATLLDGGSEGDALHLVAYGAVGAAGSALLARWVHRAAPRSSLAFAEVVSWRTGAWLSLVILVGGAVGLVLERTGPDAVGPYVDPVLLLVAVALLTPAPVRLLRDGTHELLEGVPTSPVAGEVERALAAVRAEHALPAPAATRVSQVGPRLLVEVVFVVPPGWTVDQQDAVRRAFRAHLVAGALDPATDVRTAVDLTTDPGLVD
ncbi:cation transporter [Cellulomonas triticagri]|uniref:cation transporter n=1 Tax=Cellulomonas triticagri TaxID=2483352 RepID=UPI00131527B7|nr:cation transporter [Cellulomonas triticagri]